TTFTRASRSPLVLSPMLGRRSHGFRGRPSAQRGRDLETQVEVTLEEAYHGTRRTISLQAVEACPTCHGTGKIQNVACATCSGSGVVSGAKRIEVKIPPGVTNGSRIRVAGKGQPGYGGGPPGNLFLIITLQKHPMFERRGDNLQVDLQVPVTACVLGGEVQVPTLKGRLSLKIPAETQNGKVFRLKGQGMTRMGDNTRGDLLARVNVVTPTKLSPKERDLFRELENLRPTS
ncbi:DnaJ C-terminal domain-containing protein, partial [Chloroflexota bacterium]